jgi:DNA-binding NarL/FixJ family response regulator
MNQVVTIAVPVKTAQEVLVKTEVGEFQGEPGKIVRIFLVDDSNDFVHAASRLLSANPRFRIVGCANSGHFALEQIRYLQPDLVIMDLVMPAMDGIQTLRLLKSQGSSTRVLLTSLGDGPEYHTSAEEAGAEGYVAKSDFGEEVTPLIEHLFGVAG